MLILPRLAALLAVTAAIATTGHCSAPSATAPSSPTTSIAYDPSQPLDAVLKPLAGAGTRYINVRYRGAQGEFVPGLLTLPASPSGKAACLILLHGLGGDKGTMFIPATVAAKRGYATLAIDIAGHGERPRIGGSRSDDLRLEDIHQAAAETIVDLRRAVDFLATRPEIDSTRIGFVGVSLGGILGTVFVAQEPRIRAAALWSAGGDWETIVTQSTHPAVRRLREKSVPTNIAAEMADVEPTRFAARIAPRPLLMINGTEDTVVPTASARALFAAAGNPKRELNLPGGHIPDLVTMLDRTLGWMNVTLGR